MCLIVFAWQPESPTVLRLAANRDEFYSRPSAALREWPDAPGVFAGRDLQAGGTCLGVTAQGRFAALTNIRDPRQKAGPRSRGALTSDYLLGQESAPAYLDRIMRDATEYAGFNLLVGQLSVLHSLQTDIAEGDGGTAESGTTQAAFLPLAEFNSFGSEHYLSTSLSRISPLKIQTFTPMMP